MSNRKDRITYTKRIMADLGLRIGLAEERLGGEDIYHGILFEDYEQKYHIICDSEYPVDRLRDLIEGRDVLKSSEMEAFLKMASWHRVMVPVRQMKALESE